MKRERVMMERTNRRLDFTWRWDLRQIRFFYIPSLNNCGKKRGKTWMGETTGRRKGSKLYRSALPPD